MLGRKGGARPRPQQHHPVPRGCTLPTRCQLTTGSPQIIPQKPHSFHMAEMHTTPPRPFCHTAKARAHLISCVGGANPPPHNHTNHTPSLRPCSAPNHTTVVCLINWHGLTFDLLSCPWKRGTGVKGHTRSGTRPPIAMYPSCTPNVKGRTGRTRLPWSNKTCINAYIAHRAWGMPTSLITINWLFMQRMLWSCFEVGNYGSFLQGPLLVANYTRIIIPNPIWPQPHLTKKYSYGFLSHDPSRFAD